MSSNDVRDEQTYAVIGAAMEVHNQLGRGFLEAVYQVALEEELKQRDVPHEREKHLPVFYKGKPLTCFYKADFVCFDNELLLELKALDQITNTERAQVLNYLKATGLRRALIINFGATKLQYERMVM